jgi:hypothetical protein
VPNGNSATKRKYIGEPVYVRTRQHPHSSKAVAIRLIRSARRSHQSGGGVAIAAHARIRLRFDLNQAIPVECMLKSVLMMSFTYRCPRTGQEVYGHVVVELINGQTYELVTCTVCGDTHLINSKTGRLLERANHDGHAFRAG